LVELLGQEGRDCGEIIFMQAVIIKTGEGKSQLEPIADKF
jgi:hypothetical protein